MLMLVLTLRHPHGHTSVEHRTGQSAVSWGDSLNVSLLLHACSLNELVEVCYLFAKGLAQSARKPLSPSLSMSVFKCDLDCQLTIFWIVVFSYYKPGIAILPFLPSCSIKLTNFVSYRKTTVVIACDQSQTPGSIVDDGEHPTLTYVSV